MNIISGAFNSITNLIWSSKENNKEISAGLISNEDLSHSEPAVPSKDVERIEVLASPKSPAAEKDPVLFKFKIPGIEKEIEIAKYWEVEDDEEEVESGNKRVPLAAKQHIAVASGVLGSAALSGYLGCKSGGSVLGAGIAGAATDLIKTYHAFTKDRPIIRNFDRALALVGLVASIYLQYGISEEKKAETVFRVLKALPLAYPAYGVLKAEMSEWDIPGKIVALSKILQEKNILSFELTKRQATLISAGLQIPPALALSLAKIDQSLAAGAGIMFKTNIRQFMNLMAESAASIESPLKKAIAASAITCASTAATVAGYVGNSLSWFTNTLGACASSVLIVGPNDAAVRTVKSSIKLAQEKAKEAKKAMKKAKKAAKLEKLDQVIANGAKLEEKTLSQKALQKTLSVAKGILYGLPAVGTAFFVGNMANDMNTQSNSGLIAALLGDAVSFSKLGTKELPVVAVLASTGVAIGLGVAAFTVNELIQTNFRWPMMSTTIALSSIASSYAIYHMKRLTRPDKIKDLQENAELAEMDAEIAKKKKKLKQEAKPDAVSVTV